MVPAAVSNRAWQDDDGIITVNLETGASDSESAAELIRGLLAEYTENTITSQRMREYVRSYLGVQYNAVLDFATDNGSNIYGASW
ncbi:hypothetical protein MPER_14660, partial [Moniliophthora perniciosa FA553]